MIIGQDEFKRLLFNENGKLVQFAKVSDDYTSGRPTLVFDGETVATVKAYPYLASYTPLAGDRVMVVSGVIIGKII